ncbi:MAG: threonine dehydratase [Planctomycetaceae bacterium]
MVPSYSDVLNALPYVHKELKPTALFEWPGLTRNLGFPFFVKHENHQPVGAFKVRGGIYLAATLSDSERAAGLLGCSTGNHGQSLAYAARRFDVACTIVVPKGNNPDKNRAIQNLGATLIEHGRDFDEAREYLEQELVPQGGRYVHSANEPKLIAGVGTMACEIFDSLSDPDVILVPIGLGSGVCGTGIVAKAIRPQTQVIGVQATGSDAVTRAWRTGKPTTLDRANTWAEGMATRSSAELTLKIMRKLMDDVILVSDEELRRACYSLLKDTHNLAEGAGAATLAAAYQQRERFAGKTVVGVMSGGNLDLNELPAILAAGELWDS